MAIWSVLFAAERNLDPSLRKVAWSRYVANQLRSFACLPPLLLFGLHVWLLGCEQIWPQYQGFVVGIVIRSLPLVLGTLLYPLLLQQVWSTRPLEPGVLRETLFQECRSHRLAVREVLVWNTGLRIANAAIAGVLAPLRYVFISDRLMRDLPTEQVRALFLHELAHAKLRHPLRRLIAMLGMATPCFGLVWPTGEFNAHAAALFCVFLFSGLLVFGRFARSLELEADYWAAAQFQDRLGYLRAIANVGSGCPDRRTWMHPSFQQRCDLVLAEPDVARRFLARHQLISIAFFGGWMGSVLLLVTTSMIAR